MKKNMTTVFTCLCLFWISYPCHAFWDNEDPVPLESVPEQVMAAALIRIDGFSPKSAEKRATSRYTEYEIEGVADSVAYSIRVKVNSQGDIVDVDIEEEDD